VWEFFYHSFGQPDRPLLPVGQHRLFTPMRTANAIAGGAPIRGSGGGSGGGGPLTAGAELSELQDLAKAEEINVSIDLAVALDGRTTGADQSSTVNRLKQQLEAYSAMRDECLARLRHGDSDGTIAAWLTPLSTQRIHRDKETHFSDQYTGTQQRMATVWLAFLNAGKRADLESQLTVVTPDIAFPGIRSLRGGLK
jgi:hypothetical protein